MHHGMVETSPDNSSDFRIYTAASAEQSMLPVSFNLTKHLKPQSVSQLWEIS